MVQLTKAHFERQLQVNHPPALHVLTKQKSIAPVSRGHGFKPHWSPEFFSGFFMQLHKLHSLRRSFLHFHFISAVHIWFISYIINTHFFHRNIWTHNWPTPNVSGFIVQLVEHRTGITKSRVQTPLKSWIFFQASLSNFKNCVHCDNHLFISKSFPPSQGIWSSNTTSPPPQPQKRRYP